MFRKDISIGIILLIFLPYLMLSQETNRNITISGYISNMQTAMFEEIEKDWYTDNLIHNRLNFKLYISNSFTTAIEVRNRFMYGEFVKYFPNYADLIDRENGWFDLSTNLVEEKSFLLHSTIDRAWIDFTAGNLQIRAGRQRINWGQNFVWNPNDIFNTYSFFDFDYEEKPGSDALRVQYYTGASSLFEAAVKIDANEDITAAGKFQFNQWSYDFQILGGLLNSEDWTLGFGWVGDIEGAGFRGEMTYLHPKENFTDTSGIFIASLGTDYTFKNSLMIQFEALYNGASLDVSGFEQYYYMPLSVKTISFTDYTFFASVSYPVTPLFNGSLSGMYFPSMDGFFLGPNLTYSLSDNIGLSFIAQHFRGEFTEGITQKMTLAFLRLKWSF
ncbi:MAG: hypothetical protein KAU83_05450 [Bacteroidales bacterium]|nr:hypothetical protein [Bacteroidales bacterium]